MVRCELWCGVECCNFRHGATWPNATEMQNVMWNMAWCGTRCPSWYAECCIMQVCVKLRCDVKYGGVEL